MTTSPRDPSAPLSVALIGCADLPEPDFDEVPTVAAFAAAGHHAEPVPWNGPGGDDLTRFDVCLLRAAWDYFEDIERFLTWMDQAATQTRFLNPPNLVRWNHHKRYLLEFERAGLTVVPTAMVERGGSLDVAATCAARGWTNGVVVKPAIGAGSWQTRRFEPGAAADAQTSLDELAAARDVIVQPLAAGFAAPGERSLIWIDGTWTHAIRKRPRYAGEDESVVADEPATADERAIGERILELVGGDPLYARLDVIVGDPATGGPGTATLVSEVELIEPSLFFFKEGGAAAASALVAATERRVQGLTAEHAS